MVSAMRIPLWQAWLAIGLAGYLGLAVGSRIDVMPLPFDSDFEERCHGAPQDGSAPSGDGIVIRCFGFVNCEGGCSAAGLN